MDIGIVGASGRMGRTLIDLINVHEELNLIGATDHIESKHIGVDVGEMLGGKSMGIVIKADPLDAFQDAKAIIDFSTPQATLINAEFAAQARIAHIIGTTGLAESDFKALHAAARHATIIQSGNMSLGVNLLAALVRQTSAALGNEFDIEIVESHHHHKVDAPSGTALLLGEAAAKGRDVELSDVSDRGRDGITGARKAGDIGFSAIRGGDIVGEHDVMFLGDGERIVLRHIATDRKLFAQGALRAALWSEDKGPGYFNMEDVLGLK